MNFIESKEQQALMLWASLVPIEGEDILRGSMVSDYLFAVPNGGKRNAREAGRMKAEGVKAGVSDLLLPVARRGFHGLWIEMKAPRPQGSRAESLTPSQHVWQLRMKVGGYGAWTVYGWNEGSDLIMNYLRVP